MAKQQRDNGGSATSSQITRIQPPAGVPSYLANFTGEQDDSKKGMGEYRILSRVKVVQATSDPDLLKIHSAGTVIFSSTGALVSPVNKETQKSAKFLFVPLVFFAEFCAFNDRKDQDSDMIEERSFDPTSEIANKSRDPDKRFERYGPGDPKAKADDPARQHKYVRRFVESMNYAGIIYGEHPLAGESCVVSFARGEYGQGTRYVNATRMNKLPLWAQVWEFNSAFRAPDEDRKWYGLDFSPCTLPDGNPMPIKESEVPVFKELYEKLKELHKRRVLMVDRKDEAGESDEAATAGTNPQTRF